MKKLEGLKVFWSDCNWSSCMLRYEAIYQNFQAPVGIVWVSRTAVKPLKKIITRSEIIFSLTNPLFLRRGVMTAIQEEIFRDCDQIITGGANSKEARKFMQKQGYKLSKDMNMWYLNKRKENG